MGVTVKLEVHPRPDLDSEQCKILGKALEQWRTRKPGRSVWGFGKDDLDRGSLPKPIYLQKLTGIEGRGLSEQELASFNPSLPVLSKAERDEIKSQLGEKATSRHVEMTISPPESFHRRVIVAGLCHDIPSELVSDILIDGETWHSDVEFNHKYFRADSHYVFIIPKPDLIGENLMFCGLSIYEWWKPQTIPLINQYLVQAGMNALIKGKLPPPVCEQIKAENLDDLVDELTIDEAERRAVLYMVRKNMNYPDNIAENFSEFLDLQMIDSFFIDKNLWTVDGDVLRRVLG